MTFASAPLVVPLSGCCSQLMEVCAHTSGERSRRCNQRMISITRSTYYKFKHYWKVMRLYRLFGVLSTGAVVSYDWTATCKMLCVRMLTTGIDSHYCLIHTFTSTPLFWCHASCRASDSSYVFCLAVSAWFPFIFSDPSQMPCMLFLREIFFNRQCVNVWNLVERSHMKILDVLCHLLKQQSSSLFFLSPHSNTFFCRISSVFYHHADDTSK